VEPVFAQLLPLLHALWWPFVRLLAMFSTAPVIGEATMPVAPRILLSLALAVVLMPAAHAGQVDPWSAHGLVMTFQEIAIGAVIGLAFQLTMAVIMVLGFLVSSQMGLSMAVMNDPLNGTSTDVVSTMLYVLSIVVFFAIDGHLVLVGVLGSSFQAWPVGAGLPIGTLQAFGAGVGWVFSAALLLAVPVIFSTLVVQIGFGFLNRVAPALNLYSLGFSVVTLFGLLMLAPLVRFVPEHYVALTRHVLDMLQGQLGAGAATGAAHG
jgi:flagellar biosynthetic protein FliR